MRAVDRLREARKQTRIALEDLHVAGGGSEAYEAHMVLGAAIREAEDTNE